MARLMSMPPRYPRSYTSSSPRYLAAGNDTPPSLLMPYQSGGGTDDDEEEMAFLQRYEQMQMQRETGMPTVPQDVEPSYNEKETFADDVQPVGGRFQLSHLVNSPANREGASGREDLEELGGRTPLTENHTRGLGAPIEGGLVNHQAEAAKLLDSPTDNGNQRNLETTAASSAAAGSYDTLAKTSANERPLTIQEVLESGRKALAKVDPSRKTEKEPTLEDLDKAAAASEAQVQGALKARHNQLEILKNKRELLVVMKTTKVAQDIAKGHIPKKFRKFFDILNKYLGLSPEQIIAAIKADIEKMQNGMEEYEAQVYMAKVEWLQAKAKAEEARKKQLTPR